MSTSALRSLSQQVPQTTSLEVLSSIATSDHDCPDAHLPMPPSGDLLENAFLALSRDEQMDLVSRGIVVDAAGPRSEGAEWNSEFTPAIFARLMEKTLSGKPEFRTWKPTDERAGNELLFRAHRLQSTLMTNSSPEDVTAHAVDIANLCMKIAEQHGDLLAIARLG